MATVLTQKQIEALRTDHLVRDLGTRSVRGGFVTLASQGAKFIVATAGTAVMARLLTPSDYGLVGMVTAIVGFIWVFGDLGLSTATLQKDDITHAQVSNLFWANVLLGVVCAVLTSALAPVVSIAFGEPRLVAITLALSLGFVVSGTGVQHQALLRRQMRFGALAMADIVSLVVGIVAGVSAAWLGAGYWAIVIDTLVSGVARTASVWLLCHWLPMLPTRNSGVRSMLRFGGHLTATNILNYFCRNLDNILIGWRWGAQPLGLYSKAYNLLLLPMQQINAPIAAVALPALSRLQTAPDQFRAYYCRAIGMMMTLGMPLVLFIVVFADELVLVILGPAWRECGTIFRLLGPAAFVGTFNVAIGWVYVPLGRGARMFRWAVVYSSVIVGSFFCGLPWGAKGVAAAYGITMFGVWWPSLWYCYRGSPIRYRDLLGVLWTPTMASIIASAGVLAVKGRLQTPGGDLSSIALGAVLFGLLYLGTYCLSGRGRQEAAAVAKALRSVIAPGG